MNLKNVCIILAHPEESRNIGSACRAMANCGIECLRIVGCHSDYDDERVKILAIHAAEIWERAEFFSDIKSATADCILSAATTRRRGKKRKGKLFLPEEFCEFAKNSSDGKIAIVFGNERAGLSDEEVASCTVGVTIPSSENFPSLNLSHAVQIICYELFRAQNPNEKGFMPIDLNRLEKTVLKISQSSDFSNSPEKATWKIFGAEFCRGQFCQKAKRNTSKKFSRKPQGLPRKIFFRSRKNCRLIQRLKNNRLVVDDSSVARKQRRATNARFELPKISRPFSRTKFFHRLARDFKINVQARLDFAQAVLRQARNVFRAFAQGRNYNRKIHDAPIQILAKFSFLDHLL